MMPAQPPARRHPAGQRKSAPPPRAASLDDRLARAWSGNLVLRAAAGGVRHGRAAAGVLLEGLTAQSAQDRARGDVRVTRGIHRVRSTRAAFSVSRKAFRVEAEIRTLTVRVARSNDPESAVPCTVGVVLPSKFLTTEPQL